MHAFSLSTLILMIAFAMPLTIAVATRPTLTTLTTLTTVTRVVRTVKTNGVEIKYVQHEVEVEHRVA